MIPVEAYLLQEKDFAYMSLDFFLTLITEKEIMSYN